jgi:hypothetical protein
MIILESFQRPKSLIHGPSPVIATIVFSSAPAWLGKPALGNVVLYNGVHGVVFGDAVSDTLKDNLDPAVEGCQVGLPQYGRHGIVTHGVTHRLTQLPRAVVEPADSKMTVFTRAT